MRPLIKQLIWIGLGILMIFFFIREQDAFEWILLVAGIGLVVFFVWDVYNNGVGDDNERWM